MKKVEIEDKPQHQQQQHLQQQQQQLQQQSSQQGYEVQTLRNDLREKSARLEAAMAEKNQLARKLKALEQRDGTDHNKKVPITSSFWQNKFRIVVQTCILGLFFKTKLIYKSFSLI